MASSSDACRRDRASRPAPRRHHRHTARRRDTIRARKLLLATGVRDALPDLPGVHDFYGTSIHHCPYCDGWENRDRPLAVYGRAEEASGLAISLLTWSRDVVVCTDGRALGAKATTPSRDSGHPGPHANASPALEGATAGSRVSSLRAARHSSAMPCSSTTGQTQQSTLAAQLGCQFTAHADTCAATAKGRTGVPHLFIAGDANGDVQFVVVAAAEGAKAAVAINKELQEDDQAAAGIEADPCVILRRPAAVDDVDRPRS